jgi:hypothetical protein
MFSSLPGPSGRNFACKAASQHTVTILASGEKICLTLHHFVYMPLHIKVVVSSANRNEGHVQVSNITLEYRDEELRVSID